MSQWLAKLQTNKVTIMSTIRKCCICGKEITSGYVFDGTDCFCSKECAVEGFDGDNGCVEILIDEGERIIWMDSLPTPPHYKVNIGCASTEDFHYCDSWKKVCNWLSERLKLEIKSQQDIDNYNRFRKSSRIGFIVFEPKEYYKNRKQYIEEVRKSEDVVRKMQLTRRRKKLMRLFSRFDIHYDNANDLWDMYPEVWQGEI